MLVKDGQEINPDQEEETENQKDDLQLSNEEIEEAVRAYAEYKRERTQQVKAAPKPEIEEQTEELNEFVRETNASKRSRDEARQAQPDDDAYGEYERVPQKSRQSDSDDYPTGLAAVKETFAPILSRINIKVVGLALVALVLGIAGYRSYIAKVEDVVTATPEPAAVQSYQPAQPVQSVDQPAPPANCTWTTEMAKITSKDNGQVCLSTGVCFSVDIQTLSVLQVGQEIPQQVCK